MRVGVRVETRRAGQLVLAHLVRVGVRARARVRVRVRARARVRVRVRVRVWVRVRGYHHRLALAQGDHPVHLG